MASNHRGASFKRNVITLSSAFAIAAVFGACVSSSDDAELSSTPATAAKTSSMRSGMDSIHANDALAAFEKLDWLNLDGDLRRLKHAGNEGQLADAANALGKSGINRESLKELLQSRHQSEPGFLSNLLALAARSWESQGRRDVTFTRGDPRSGPGHGARPKLAESISWSMR